MPRKDAAVAPAIDPGTAVDELGRVRLQIEALQGRAVRNQQLGVPTIAAPTTPEAA